MRLCSLRSRPSRDGPSTLIGCPRSSDRGACYFDNRNLNGSSCRKKWQGRCVRRYIPWRFAKEIRRKAFAFASENRWRVSVGDNELSGACVRHSCSGCGVKNPPNYARPFATRRDDPSWPRFDRDRRWISWNTREIRVRPSAWFSPVFCAIRVCYMCVCVLCAV